jgi:uncharacterized protein YegP (UPF0339 family)
MKTLGHNFPTLALVLALALPTAACALDEGPVSDTGTVVGGKADEVSSRPYFEVFEGRDGRYYFHLSAANHEIILASQGYNTRTMSLAGVLSVLDNAGIPERYELLQATNGQWYFNLTAANGAVIGTSELYTTKWNAKKGIEAVDRNVGDYLGFLATRTGARFSVNEAVDGRYYFLLHAGNGEIVLQSQAYTVEAAAFNGTFSVVDHGRDADNYEILEAKDGAYYFNLMAPNGQVIATSEMYDSKFNAERARDSIIALLPSVELL